MLANLRQFNTVGRRGRKVRSLCWQSRIIHPSGFSLLALNKNDPF
jgi:hypothetical protein